MKKLILTLILGLTFTIPVFANGDNDNTDRLTSNQNYTFSPGYINAAKQQTDAILRQESPKKSLFDRAVEYVQSKLARKVEENANSKVTPNLQMRTSASQDSSQVASIATTLIDSSQYNVAIGTGTNQERDAFGRLMAEVINGTRHVYAGFDNYGTGTIQEAINKTNAGDMILVRGGANKTYDIANLYLKNGVSMYGGYDEYGVRDIENNVSSLQIAYNASSGIVLSNVDRPTEINGFNIIGGTFTNYCIRIDGSSNIMIANNRFKNAYEGVFTFGALSTVIKNNIFETKNGIDGWNGTNNLTILSNIFNNQTSSVKCNIGTTALIKDNIFNEYSSALYIQTSTDAASTVTSINNNFNKSGYAIFCGGIGVTSYNDYFAGPVKYYSSFGYYTPTISNESTKPNVYMKAQDTKVGVMNAPSDTTYGSYNKNLIESRMWGTNYNLKEEANLVLKNFNNMDPNTAAGIFSGLLANKDKFGRDPNMPIDPNQLKLIVNDVLSQNALAIPMDGLVRAKGMEIAAKFANILGNPTEDQKVLIDAIKGLLQDMNKVEKEEAEAGTNPELKKASDNLIQMVANILLAQAIPDLLKEGDIHGIKGIFKELDTVKTRIMREYEAATTPYYDKIKKDIMKNVNVLQLNNVISNTLAEEELRNMPRSNIDIIIAKLKKLEKRSFEEDYILQQESKYRKDYLDPNKKKLEDDMKGILENVTKKLNRTLEDVAKK